MFLVSTNSNNKLEVYLLSNIERAKELAREFTAQGLQKPFLCKNKEVLVLTLNKLNKPLDLTLFK